MRYVAIPLVGVALAWIAFRTIDPDRLGLRLRGGAARRVCLAAVCAGLFLSGLLVARYATWHSFVFDLGSYDQKVWLAATRPDLSGILEQTYRGGMEVSPCGAARYWGICHFQPLYILYAFAYRIWASPLVLLVSQALLVASAMIPCYLLGRDRLGDPAAGVMASLLYLLHPAVQFNGLLDFRPDHIAIPCLFWAYWLLQRGRFGLAMAAATVPALAKESLILSFACFGLYAALSGRRRLVGAAAFGVGLVAFLALMFQVLGGTGRSEGAFLVARYFSVGSPLFAPELLARKLAYLIALFGPLGFLSVLDPRALLPAAPSLLISLSSTEANFSSIGSQYSASVIAPAFAAFYTGLAWLAPRFRAAPLRAMGGLAVLSASFSVALGPTPLSVNFWSEAWGRQWHHTRYLPDRQEALNDAARLIPTDSAVMVVTQNDVNSAGLAHRHYYFAFPNGLERADYVILDTRRMPFVYWVAQERRPYEEAVRRLRASPDYRLLFDRDGILLFWRHGERRPGPPDPVAGSLPTGLPR